MSTTDACGFKKGDIVTNVLPLISRIKTGKEKSRETLAEIGSTFKIVTPGKDCTVKASDGAEICAPAFILELKNEK